MFELNWTISLHEAFQLDHDGGCGIDSRALNLNRDGKHGTGLYDGLAAVDGGSRKVHASQKESNNLNRWLD